MLIVLSAFLLIYLSGVLLTYGRINASFREVEEIEPEFKLKNILDDPETRDVALRIMLLSWVGFASGCIIYKKNKEKYFLSFRNWN